MENKFMNIEEGDFINLENEEMTNIKISEGSSSLVRIIYNKKDDLACACYGGAALLSLKSKTAKEAIEELKERSLEFLAELTVYNTYHLAKKLEEINNK